VTLKKLKPSVNLLALAPIYLLLSISTVIWTLKDKTPPAWDPADHMIAGYDYYTYLARFDLAGFGEDFFARAHYYPPSIHIVTALVFVLFGASRLAGIAVNLISLGVLLGSTHSIVRMLYGPQSIRGVEREPWASIFWPGVLAATLAACYHFSAWLLHDAFLDYPLTAIVTLTVALLIRAGGFESRRDSLLLGAAIGAGLLTKQTFAFFLAFPLLYTAARVLYKRDRRAVLNLVLALLVAAAIAAVWYLPHLDDVLAIYRMNREAAVAENEQPLWGFMSNMFYLHALLSYQMQVPLAALFVAGLVYSFARRFGRSVIIYCWLFGGLAAFTAVANKDVRYTVPVLPAAAVLSVCWISGLRASARSRLISRSVYALKLALVAAAAVWGLASFFNAQWPRDGMGYYLDMPRFRWMVFARNYYGFDHRPLEHDWAVPQIVKTISDKSARTAGSPSEAVGVVVNLPYLNPSNVALYARLLEPERAGPPLFKVVWLVADSARDQIADCDYVVIRTGLDRAEWVAPLERYVEVLVRDRARFVWVASFPIPLEGAEAVIYKRVG
jgi:4-amino-4-deoxy-L-arabinose transferase-like glycosyltransferase